MPGRGAGWPTERFGPVESGRKATMRDILLWILGIPVPILVLLYLFNVI
jgi:hypothetical protein